jgi:polyphosphate kinase
VDYEPEELLQEILSEASHQQAKFGDALDEIIEELKNEQVFICRTLEEIPSVLQKALLHYFKTQVAAFLRLSRIDHQDKLFLDNQAIYLAIRTEADRFFNIKIPSDKLPRFYHKNVDGTDYYVFLDDIIRLHLDIILRNEKVIECYSIKLNKNADLQIDDEYEGDLAKKIEKQIEKRNLGVPARFLFDMNMSDELLKMLADKLTLSDDDIVTGGRYHNLNDLFQISPKKPNLLNEELPTIPVASLETSRSIFEQIDQKDLFFHFPYHSYDFVLQFFNEAAIDPDVSAIYVTFYRMAKNSLIAEALISAALNGKSVYVFMELKARFDEANNLQWAKKLEDAGVHIHYSLPGLKVHAKVATVVKKSTMYGYFGTGNLNEKTSEIYSDFGMLSSNVAMNTELLSVFNFLISNKQPDPFNHLIVSQFNAFDHFMGLIDREIGNVKNGKKGLIIIKINNLQEQNLISKIYEAAEAGVEVRLLVRSICCLVPQKNLKVKRIVDRFLEHARAFYFENNGDNEMYLGSSDWMNRSIYRRVEVSFPIYDPEIKKTIRHILDIHWKDDVKGVWLNERIENVRPPRKNKVRAQINTYTFLKGINH